MRKSHVVATLAACTAGLTAVVAVNRRAVAPLPVRESAVPVRVASPIAEPVTGRDAVVLPFARPAVAGPAQEELPSPLRCGDSGGRTKAGVPCGARTTAGGRCHHHPMAA